MSEPISPKPCPKCGAPGEPRKAGNNRFWIQCAKYGANGNCSAISQQMPSKKEAIAAWNRMK